MSERALKQQLEKGEILKSVSWEMCKEQAWKLSSPQGYDGIYNTPEDQSKVTFLQNVKQTDVVLQVLWGLSFSSWAR